MTLGVEGSRDIVAASGERWVPCPYMVERLKGKYMHKKSDETRGSRAL